MISIQGVYTVIEDADNHLHKWMEKYQTLDDLRLFCDVPSPVRSLANASRSCKGGGPGIPRPNFPENLPPRLNTLYWPTGASRWSYGLFLANTRQMTTIGVQGVKSLVMADPDGIAITASMWMLPPRQVSSFETDVDSDLWLIPLVDDRYWWQFRTVEELNVLHTTTWEDVFTLIGSAIGTTIEYDPVGGYLKPDPIEMSRRYANAAVMLDAVASSLGQRVVRTLDGVVKSQNASTAAGQHDENVGGDDAKIIAGGDNSSVSDSAPQSVVVSFRKTKCGTLLCPRTEYKVEVPAAGAVLSPASTRKLIKSTAYAENSLSETTPSNLSTLSALASVIAADFYSWCEKSYDITYASLKAWVPDGFDNYVEWSFGRQLTDGRRLAQTRVQSMPPDHGVEQQLSQDPGLKISDCCGEIIRFKMTDTLALAGKSTAIEIKSGPGYEEMGEEFPIKDPWDNPGSWREDLKTHEPGDGETYGDGYRGFAIVPPCPEFDEETGEAYREIIWMEQIARSITFTLTEDMGSQFARATVDNWYLGKNPEDVFDIPLQVWDPQELFPLAITGCKGKARYNDRDHRYEIVTCDQMVLMMRCSLLSDMCPGDDGQLTAHQPITWPPYGKMPEVLPPTATNPHNLAGQTGDSVTIVYNYSSNAWDILQVGHHEVELAEDLEATTCSIGIITRPYSVQRCRTDAGGSSIPFVVHQYMKSLRAEGCSLVAEVGFLCALGPNDVEDVTSVVFTEKDVVVDADLVDSTESSGYEDSQCVLQLTTHRVCVLEPEVPTITLVEAMRFQPVVVVQDIRQNDLCIQQYVSVAYVPCFEDGDWEDAICGVDCIEEGSGE